MNIMKINERISCLNGLVEIILWEKSVKATDDEVAAAFPYIIKPQEVYMDETGERTITFNLLNEYLEDGQMGIAIRAIQKIVKKIYPESIYHKARCTQANYINIGWFSFVTGGLREEQFHIMFILPINGRMMFGSYHIPVKYMEEEMEFFLQMINNIKIKV